MKTMNAQDRGRWQAAISMPQLGQTMASWLAGDIGSRPGRPPNYGPAAQTLDHPGLLYALTAANSVGFVTTRSQPGGEGIIGGRGYQKIAAVEGLAVWPVAQSLIDAATAQGFLYHLWYGPRPWWKVMGWSGVTVAIRDGQPLTTYGDQLGAGQLRRDFWECNRAMTSVLAASCQLVIYQPDIGANDLWPMLEQWAKYIR